MFPLKVLYNKWNKTFIFFITLTNDFFLLLSLVPVTVVPAAVVPASVVSAAVVPAAIVPVTVDPVEVVPSLDVVPAVVIEYI